ncbi:type II toxin-antitoxin system RelE/ParE family toxin [Virgibacillus sp. NKC19-16]|nr:type II toxin-antitoxin system RelE/ParE family toxin [Virgibacillus sp. NKC19-16]
MKRSFEDAFKEILTTPKSRELKIGDLSGIYTYDFRTAKVNNRIAYTIKEDEEGTYIIFILERIHENFYRDLRRFLN